MKKHILLIGDETNLQRTGENLQSKYKKEANVTLCDKVDETEKRVQEIDASGGELVVAVFDKNSIYNGRRNLLHTLSNSHPDTKKIAIIPDYHLTKLNLNGVIPYTFSGNGDAVGLCNLVGQLAKDYDTQRGLEIHFGKDKEYVIKQARTLHELNEWFSLRYQVYVEEEKHLKLENLTSIQKQSRMEWDTYDFQNQDSLPEKVEDFNPNNMTFVVLKRGKAVGGVRMIDEDIPIKSSYSGFDEFALRESAYPREVSRLIVDEEHRQNKRVLLGLVRLIYQYGHKSSKAQKDLLCTSKKNTVKLYERMGFYLVDDKPLSDYKLDGGWFFMHLDMDSTFVGNYRSRLANKYFINLITQDLHGMRGIGSVYGKIYEAYNAAMFQMTRNGNNGKR
jgi:hypothetical protein